MNDLKYWTEYYKNNKGIKKTPSPFAEYLLESGVIVKNLNLIELGCGNGRDSMFFAKNDVNVTAIDQCENTTTILNKIDNIHSYPHDFTNLPPLHKEHYIDIIYSRFTIHSINEESEDRTLKWVYENLKKGGLFCIEARTVKDPLCGKGEDKGNHIWFYNNHHRRFLDAEKFRSKLIALGFEIKLFDEKNGFAKYKNEDPIILRAIVEKI